MRIPWLEPFQKDSFHIVLVCTPGHTLEEIEYQSINWGEPWRTDSTETANLFPFTYTRELVERCSKLSHLQNSGFKLAACWTAASYLWSWLLSTVDWSNLINAAFSFSSTPVMIVRIWCRSIGIVQPFSAHLRFRQTFGNWLPAHRHMLGPNPSMCPAVI